MISGIGLTSVPAAAIAAHFVEQDSGGKQEGLEDRLDRIERILAQLVAASADEGQTTATDEARTATDERRGTAPGAPPRSDSRG